jgi:hypothetical protein
VDGPTIVFGTFKSSSKITSKVKHIAHMHLQSEDAYMSIVLRCGQNTCTSQPLYFVSQRV